MKIIFLFLAFFSFSLEIKARFMTCTASSCGTLRGFKECLADPSSPYRYFIFHPQYVKRTEAVERFRRFTLTHPNCYAQFCNRVCAGVPKKFSRQKVDSFDDEETSWLTRQVDRLRQNERWRAQERDKRTIIEKRIQRLCKRNDMAGAEMRLMCSECAPYVKRDRRLISECQLMNNEKQSKSNQYGRWDGSGYDEGYDSENDSRFRRNNNVSYYSSQPNPIDWTPLRQQESMEQPSKQKKRKRSQEDMSDTLSQSSRFSRQSNSSRSSQSSRSSALTAENLARHNQEQDLEEGFSDDGLEEGSEVGSETSSTDGQ